MLGELEPDPDVPTTPTVEMATVAATATEATAKAHSVLPVDLARPTPGCGSTPTCLAGRPSAAPASSGDSR